MAVSKTFECPECGAEGKIVIKGDDIRLSDVVYCPVCSSNIQDDDIGTDDDI